MEPFRPFQPRRRAKRFHFALRFDLRKLDAEVEKPEFLEGYGDFEPTAHSDEYEMGLGLTDIEELRMFEKFGEIRERRYRL